MRVVVVVVVTMLVDSRLSCALASRRARARMITMRSLMMVMVVVVGFSDASRIPRAL